LNRWELEKTAFPMSVYRTPASGVFRRKGFGFAGCDNNRASVSWFVAIIGPAFRGLRRESGNDRFDRAAHPGRRPCAKITLRNGARIIDKTWPADN
jgi:hypothetical protein